MAGGCQDATHETPPPPAAATPPSGSATGPLAGIGIRPISDPKGFAIGQLFPNGAAANAGMRVGDVVVSVNGESSARWTLTRVAERLRGPAGSQITLVVERPDGPQTFTLQRAVLVVPDAPQ